MFFFVFFKSLADYFVWFDLHSQDFQKYQTYVHKLTKTVVDDYH